LKTSDTTHHEPYGWARGPPSPFRAIAPPRATAHRSKRALSSIIQSRIHAVAMVHKLQLPVLRLVRAMAAAARCSPLATTVDLAGDGHEARANRRRTLHPWPPTSAIRGGSESTIRTLLTTAPNACGRLKRYLGASSKLRAQCASLVTSVAGRHGASSTCRRQTCHAPSRTVSFQHEIQSAD